MALRPRWPPPRCLPHVLLVTDYADGSRQKAALRLILSRQHIARPFTLPPGVPEDRLAARRQAFDATMKDRDFVAEAIKADLEVRPENGIAMTALIRELHATPPDIAKLATEVVRD